MVCLMVLLVFIGLLWCIKFGVSVGVGGVVKLFSEGVVFVEDDVDGGDIEFVVGELLQFQFDIWFNVVLVCDMFECMVCYEKLIQMMDV